MSSRKNSARGNIELKDTSPLVTKDDNNDENMVNGMKQSELALNGEVADDINYFHWRHFGLFLQYFFVGIGYTFTISLNYEFFTSYLGQTGNFYNVARSAVALPWSLKFVYGAINDCVPILGYRRKPYMAFGWIGCALTAFLLFSIPLPDSRFVHDEVEIAKGNCDVKGVIKENSEEYYKKQSFKYMTLLFVFNVFLVLTDVAMDGLMVQYARRESMKKRGAAQTMIYVCRQVGMVVGSLVKGFGLNWYDYSGPWCNGIDLTHIFLLTALASCLAVPTVLFMTTEEKVQERKTVQHVASKTWTLLQSKAIQQILVFQMSVAILSAISSPADSMIQRKWVGVDNLTNNVLVGVLGGVMFSIGSSVFAKYLMDYSWVVIFAVTTLAVVLANAAVTYIVIFDVIRNQYFYLSDALTMEFFVGVHYICGLLLFIELSESDNEGLSYALLTTSVNASMALGPILANLMTYPFDVSDHQRFDRDSQVDRKMVALQYVIVYTCNLSVILFLPLLPKGKKETQELKAKAGTSKIFGAILIVVIFSLFVLSLLYNFFLYRILPD